MRRGMTAAARAAKAAFPHRLQGGGQKYVPLLLRARELWRELEAATGVPLLTLNGGLMIGRDTLPGMVNVLATVEQFGR